MYRHISPKVKQSTRMTCYAAALESYLRITPFAPKMTQAEIVGQYGDPTLNGGVSENQLLQIFDDLDLVYVDSRGGNQLTEGMIETRLQDGHVILCYKSSQLNSHCLVIYGISHANGLPQISYMDPWYGQYGWSNLKDFNGKPWVLASAHRYRMGLLD